MTPACMQLVGQVQEILPASKAAAGSERTRGRAAAAASSREAAGSAWAKAHSWVEGCSGPEQACSAAMCCRKLAAAAATSTGMAGSASVPARPWAAAGSCSCHSLRCQKRRIVLNFFNVSSSQGQERHADPMHADLSRPAFLYISSLLVQHDACPTCSLHNSFQIVA